MGASQRIFIVCKFGGNAPSGEPRTSATIVPADFGDRLLLDHVVLVRSDRTADEIRDLFHGSAGPAKILVIEAGTQAAWSGLNAIDADWLLKRL